MAASLNLRSPTEKKRRSAREVPSPFELGGGAPAISMISFCGWRRKRLVGLRSDLKDPGQPITFVLISDRDMARARGRQAVDAHPGTDRLIASNVTAPAIVGASPIGRSRAVRP